MKRKQLIAALLSAMPFMMAQAQTTGEEPALLRQVVQQAVDANPDVQAQWHAFLAAGHEYESVRAGFLPSVDVYATVGRQFERVNRDPSTDYDRVGLGVSLTQMLYDGFFTSSQAQRFDHARMVRFYELLESTEEVALEAVRAYIDVARYQQLLEFAKESYVAHKVVYDQILDRSRAGVGRGVDLELAAGRLALAESNLLTETANLHDVTARYVRIVGEAPPANLPELTGFSGVPVARDEALKQAYEYSPRLKAAVANIRAGQEQVNTRRAAYHPRLDFRVRQDYARSLDNSDVREREGAVELVLNYNLYRGGADKARLRQAAEELNADRDVREKVCRDIRQDLSIALNDVASLESQMRYLDQHQLSMSKAREAYRQQFDIGQRTLLDLLDGENEYFDARRAYANAHYNRLHAQARALANMGRLLEALDIVRAEMPEDGELRNAAEYVEPESVCPPVLPTPQHIDKEALLSELGRTQPQGMGTQGAK